MNIFLILLLIVLAVGSAVLGVLYLVVAFMVLRSGQSAWPPVIAAVLFISLAIWQGVIHGVIT